MSFNCKRCGLCCIYSLPMFYRHEMEFVKKEAEEMGITFTRVDMDGVEVYFPKETYKRYAAYVESSKDVVSPEAYINLVKQGTAPKFLCEFFVRDDGEAYCSIYKKRPWGCHIFGPQVEPEFRCINMFTK